jgi:hypothetical protein
MLKVCGSRGCPNDLLLCKGLRNAGPVRPKANLAMQQPPASQGQSDWHRQGSYFCNGPEADSAGCR